LRSWSFGPEVKDYRIEFCVKIIFTMYCTFALVVIMAHLSSGRLEFGALGSSPGSPLVKSEYVFFSEKLRLWRARLF